MVVDGIVIVGSIGAGGALVGEGVRTGTALTLASNAVPIRLEKVTRTRRVTLVA